MNYKSLLKSKKFKIAVWGTGYIGLSTMVYFAKKKQQITKFQWKIYQNMIETN